ncbi:unnamed protein product [Rotaria sp. Silwood2]|nr:unnamed protein product [Rotaria sp. Silwood2]CAF4113713.1 unnamed protein product [Rotaria sp. Silwood2]
MTFMNSLSKSRAIWRWKSNTNPWANTEPDTWEQYSDIESYIIENAHQQNQNKVELDDFWIDFNKQIQINKQNPNKQRLSRRKIMDISDEHIREHRFAMQQPKSRYQSLSHDPFRSFIHNSRFNLISDDAVNDEMIEKAAHGIEVDGTKLNRKQEAQCIANELRKVKNGSTKEILDCCVKLYTAESFCTN